jgi:hypothetical protein
MSASDPEPTLTAVLRLVPSNAGTSISDTSRGLGVDPRMKIFWSWQSDTPGNIGRHFVRGALKSAIEILKQAPEIEEPLARESREALHLDQDRSGVPGSPDLVRTILAKIEQSSVFIGDVTSVGASVNATKKIINPNVAIELGYALHALTDRALLMVMNEHYGQREDLPFDLRHKAGPILFRLAPDALKREIEAEERRLCAQLVKALRPYLSLSITSEEPVFERVPIDTWPRPQPDYPGFLEVPADAGEAPRIFLAETLEEILKAVSRMPPLSRQALSKAAYVGRWIRYRATISAIEEGENCYRVFTSSLDAPGRSIAVSLTFPLSWRPDVEALRVRDRIHADGQIRRLDNSIELVRPLIREHWRQSRE